MKPRQSDIMEAYFKLAEEKGLGKTADDRARNQAQAEAAEHLYNTKPKQLVDYDYNIVEVAHPDPVVVALPLDPIQGLVENINEKQNIIIHRIQRFPSEFNFGALKPENIVTASLAKELIRIGNDMDNADEEEIRILADECLAELQKQADWGSDLTSWVTDHVGADVGRTVGDALSSAPGAVEGAAIGAILTSWLGPGAAVGALAGAGVGGLIGYLTRSSPKVQNVKENSKELLNQLGDLEKAVPEEAPFYAELKNILSKVGFSSDKYLAAIDKVQKHTLNNEDISEEEKQEIEDATKDFKADTDLIVRLQKEFERKVSVGAFAKASGGIGHLGIINDDVQDVQKSFLSLRVAIENIQSSMKSLGQKAKIEEQKAAAPAVAPAPGETSKPAAQRAPDLSKDDWDNFRNAVGGDLSPQEKEFFNLR